jgi:hypothetical protein
MSESPLRHLIAVLRAAAHDYAKGDRTPPAVVLWPDPARDWETLIPDLRRDMPELFALGPYAPEQRTGPALWLRCLEARTVTGAPEPGCTPVFYLPGVGRDDLKAAESAPPEWIPLVELQYRGTVWLHENGKEWTPSAFVQSERGGLGLDLARDQETLSALAGSLRHIFAEPLDRLRGRRLDAEFLHALILPDPVRQILNWLASPDPAVPQGEEPAWNAFRLQCRAEFGFDPVKDGRLKAAQLLAGRQAPWDTVWKRFEEAPGNYLGLIPWLKRAAPRAPTFTDTAEVWPDLNERDEKQLAEALAGLADRSQDEVVRRVGELETQHGGRRAYVWAKLGQSPMAGVLAHLHRLAVQVQNRTGAPDAEGLATRYMQEGWRTDEAALSALGASQGPDAGALVSGVVRALYLPWLEQTARQMQSALAGRPRPAFRQAEALAAEAGRAVLFADGLRMDVGQRLVEDLISRGLQVRLDWEWSTVPSVTATAKPAASPLAGAVTGTEDGDGFGNQFRSTGQRLTQDRFLAALRDQGWQTLSGNETGDPSGQAWTESGTLDKRGHNEGWKLARLIPSEVQDLAERIARLLRDGWREVVVVTDHGWLLMPGGLPKVELKAFLAEDRWGRCALMKPGLPTSGVEMPWHWNPTLAIASPPGAGCFRAGLEYTHGGISPQEMVIPRLRVTLGRAPGPQARIKRLRWNNASARVEIEAESPGLRVDVRRDAVESESSLLSNHQPQTCKPDGKVTVYLESDADLGEKAFVVLLTPDGARLDTLETICGENAHD